jgi:hypothetical protein
MDEVEVGQVWKTGDGMRITVQQVEGETVSGSQYDPKSGASSVWVGSAADFDSLALVSPRAE